MPDVQPVINARLFLAILYFTLLALIHKVRV